MKFSIVCICIVSVCTLYDCVRVYNETHNLNVLIESEVNKIKSHSPVAVYISTPRIYDPLESVIQLVENLFMIWFLAFSYLFIYFIQLVRLPHMLFFLPNYFIL